MSALYLVTAPEVDRVKIGSSNDPQLRLQALQVGCPVKLHLFKHFARCGSAESDLHAIFKDYRIIGEWFGCVGAVRDFMDDVEHLNSETLNRATLLVCATCAVEGIPFDPTKTHRNVETGVRIQREAHHKERRSRTRREVSDDRKARKSNAAELRDLLNGFQQLDAGLAGELKAMLVRPLVRRGFSVRTRAQLESGTGRDA